MIPLILAAVQGVMQAGAMGASDQASKVAEARALALGKYNASLDTTEANQGELDTRVNVERMRESNQAYLSRQHSAYAASGVLNTGSPLAVQAQTAGRLEMGVKQMYLDSLRKQDLLRSEAGAGLRSSAAQAQAYSNANTAAQLNGGAALARTAYNAYQNS